MTKTEMKKKIEGCMLGGAVGDALGYAVEFRNWDSIYRKYGQKGITRYELDERGLAPVSDDTQMSLFTANAMLIGMTRGCCRGIMGRLDGYCWNTYRDWYLTQTNASNPNNMRDWQSCWLLDIPELYVRRAPGNTCLSAISSNINGKEVHNDSCGCGGVMRTAPISLISIAHDYNGEMEQDQLVAHVSAMAARITHHHPLGFLPSAVLAIVLNNLLRDKNMSLEEALKNALTILPNIVSEDDDDKTYAQAWPRHTATMIAIMELALKLSKEEGITDLEGIQTLGQGWTGHEALAIAMFCALRHPDNFEDAIVAAVNHSGDSDSTGAICGNIMGTKLGITGIPKHYLKNLEMADIIREMADDLATGCIISEYRPITCGAELRWGDLYQNGHRRGDLAFYDNEYATMNQRWEEEERQRKEEEKERQEKKK